MIDRVALLAELAGHVEALCEPRQHAENIWDTDAHGNKRLRRVYVTVQPGLLAQLRAIAHQGLRVYQDISKGRYGKPGSRPPGNFDALDRHVYIAVNAARWVEAYGTRRQGVEDTVRALVGCVQAMTDDDLANLVRQVRYWHRSATIASGWVERPFSPPVPCPLCGRRGSLRVNIDDRSAYCTNRDAPPGAEFCDGAWPSGAAEPLFAYIREQFAEVAA